MKAKQMKIYKLFSELLTIFLVFIFFSPHTYAQNPITPPGVFFADPSAHIWNGKLYLYGSLDESCDYWCSSRHHVIETKDMKTWKIHENVFESAGNRDQVTYNDQMLYAPDCAFATDTFYLYYCQPDGFAAEGLATSKNPEGPFINGQKLNIKDYQQIDPSLFIDDDGQAYYIWGQFSLKMAKMKPNMRELDLSTLKDSVITEKEHFFHEGSFLAKRKGIYYLVYADISRAEMPTCLGYSTSLSPFGPYKYGGVIVDNDQCNPGNWNNHGSIAEFNNNWYVFYHRSTNGCDKMRKACVEPISFLPDGSIPEVEMTSQGAGNPLNAFSKIEVETACNLQGNIRIHAFSKDQEELAQIRNGDKAVFKYIDFGTGANRIKLRVSPGSKGGKIFINADKPWHQQLAEIVIEPNPDKKEWRTLSFNIEKVSGVHALYLSFQGEGDDLMSIDWFEFD
jgi:arabinoxylan arabinofuranohydrolase